MNITCRIYAVQCDSRNCFPLNIGAEGIKLVQGTNYSHYALMMVLPGGIVYFYDSTASGVRINLSDVFTGHYKITKKYFIDEIGFSDFDEFFDVHRGKGYGFGQIFGIFLKILKIVVNNPFGKGMNRIICNELIILYTNHRKITNIKDTDSLDLNDTTEILDKI